MKNKIQEQLDLYKNDIPRLMEYIKRLPLQRDINKDVYLDLLDYPDELVKNFAAEQLFEKMKIEIAPYKNKLMAKVADKTEDFDLRLLLTNVLTENYKDNKDKSLMRLFYDLYEDKLEDEKLRASFIFALLRLNGMEYRDIVIRNQNLGIDMDDINVNEFQKEIDSIVNYLNS